MSSYRKSNKPPEWMSVVLVLTIISLVLFVLLELAGCRAVPRAVTPPKVFGVRQPVNGAAAQVAWLLWPVAVSGALLLIGGAVMGALTRSWHLLLAGLAVCLIAPLVMLLFESLRLIVMFAMIGAVIIAVAWYGSKIYMGRQAKKRAAALRTINDETAQVEARALDWVGLKFNPMAPFIRRHTKGKVKLSWPN